MQYVNRIRNAIKVVIKFYQYLFFNNCQQSSP